jgi:hypothetical protein
MRNPAFYDTLFALCGAGTPEERQAVVDTVEYEWPNKAEHDQWLDTATMAEIADWVKAVTADDGR